MPMTLATGQVLRWLGDAGDAVLENGLLTVRAGPGTDWFSDPATLERTANTPVLLSAINGDCQLAALVRVGFEARFDAGVLFVHQSPDRYAKLCFEQSPAGERTVVSVVTQTTSDDANGPVVESDQVWLRISVIGDAMAFHWSVDGREWTLKRYFRFADPTAPTSLGFCSQSPTGAGCTSRFSQIAWTPTTLVDVRDGT